MAKNETTGAPLPRRDFVKKAAAGIGAAALTGISAKETSAAGTARHWDLGADVIVVGAGASGLPASIEAIQNGATVIVIEQNHDIGGHGIESGGNIALGGGTSLQKKFGGDPLRIGSADSPFEMYF